MYTIGFCFWSYIFISNFHLHMFPSLTHFFLLQVQLKPCIDDLWECEYLTVIVMICLEINKWNWPGIVTSSCPFVWSTSSCSKLTLVAQKEAERYFLSMTISHYRKSTPFSIVAAHETVHSFPSGSYQFRWLLTICLFSQTCKKRTAMLPGEIFLSYKCPFTVSNK